MKVEGAQRADTSGVVTNKHSTIHSPLRSKGPNTCIKELVYVGICTLAAAWTRGGKVFGWVGFDMLFLPVFLRDAMIACNSDCSLSPTQPGCSEGVEQAGIITSQPLSSIVARYPQSSLTVEGW